MVVASSSDRRAEQRLPFSLTAHCQVGTDYTRGHVVDVSRRGLCLHTHSTWPPGTPLRVALALPHAEGPRFCTLVGTVVRAWAQGVGVRLDDAKLGHVDREVLQGFLALLSMRRQMQA